MNLAASLALCPLLCTPPIAGEGISSQTAQPITTPPKKDERAQSAFTFVDRSKLIPRGKISCSVRKELADGIEGADVHKLKTDLGEILNLLNEIEKQNEPFTLEKAIETGKIKSENALLIDYLTEVDRSKIAKGTESLTLKDLLAHVLYNTTGKKLGEDVPEHLFGPLGITDFNFSPSLPAL
jgi:hypothetical protein